MINTCINIIDSKNQIYTLEIVTLKKKIVQLKQKYLQLWTWVVTLVQRWIHKCILRLCAPLFLQELGEHKGQGANLHSMALHWIANAEDVQCFQGESTSGKQVAIKIKQNRLFWQRSLFQVRREEEQVFSSAETYANALRTICSKLKYEALKHYKAEDNTKPYLYPKS